MIGEPCAREIRTLLATMHHTSKGSMTANVKLVECPRDAWQGLAHIIPTADKIAYLRALLAAGFRHLDAVSLVASTAVPQMADSESVLAQLDLPTDAEIIGIVVNERGAERAIATGHVSTLGYPHSISQEFLSRNQHQTIESSLTLLERLQVRAVAGGLDTVAYLSMAFGNPYGEPWSLDQVLEACRRIADCGVRQLSLADTVGAATPEQIAETLAAVFDRLPSLEVGVHLHARRHAAPERIRAAYHVGCRRFDSALGGLGGCPFAQDALVGNIPTEVLIETLADCGATLPPFLAHTDSHTAASDSTLAALVASSQKIAAAPAAAARSERL